VKPNDQISLKGAVSQQPVSIAIEADTKYFQSYSGGILTSSSCGTNLDHGVLIVGYGKENGIEYWLVKNSWGTSWGDKGYVKIARSDSTDDAGICGIAMDPSFPTV
jgi:C1A family cysteine protease